MSAIPKSWKPSRREGSSSLYCLIGDFVSQEIAFVSLIKVFVAIAYHGGVHFLDGPGRWEAAHRHAGLCRPQRSQKTRTIIEMRRLYLFKRLQDVLAMFAVREPP
jgi:hypothetical protein